MRYKHYIMLVATLCVLTFIAAGLLLEGYAAAQSSPKPIWSTDLGLLGYQQPMSNGQPKSGRQVAFGSNDELVVMNDSGMCSKENPAIVFALDARSGKLRHKQQVVTNCWPYVFGTAADNYAVMTSSGMAVYSSGFEKQLTVDPDVAAERISPDGTTIGAWKQIPGHGKTYLVSSSSLQPFGREFLDKNVISVSDTGIANVVTRLGSTNQVVLIDNGSSPPSELNTECGMVQGRFLNADMLIVLGCKTLRVFSVGAGTAMSLQHDATPGKDWLAATSRNGERFATIQTTITPGYDSPDRIAAERISVFDVKAHAKVFTAEIKELHGLDMPSHSSGIALSPNGKLLVVNSEGHVQMFALP